MATTVFLLRHAAHDRVADVLCGRMPGVHLGETGRRQAEALAQRFAGVGVAAVWTSPLQRARETAGPIGARLGLRARASDALCEIDFGAWTGRDFASLADDPVWEIFNSFRSGTRPPGGETMLEVQARVVGFFDELRRRHPDGHVAAVSHCDVLRSAILHYLGAPLDLFLRLEIEPASLSILELAEWGPRLILLNETAATR
jgi:probable phosphoglycerate mutase